MRPAEVRVQELAGRQCGVVSRRQMLGLGLSSRQIQRRLATGALEVLHPGVYRSPISPPCFEQAVAAACLASGGVASHRAAGALWALRGVPDDVVEVTVPGRRRPDRAGVTAHTTDRLDAADVASRNGYWLTSPARTLLDLGAVAPTLVEPAMEDALLRGLVALPTLRSVLDRVGGHGRPGTAVLRRLVAERTAASAPTESPLEDAIVRVLRRHGLPEPVRQHPVRAPGGAWFRLDLAYPEGKLAIEADGRRWHSGRADFEADRSRGNHLACLGWTVLRFSWADVRGGGSRLAAEVAMLRRELVRSAG